MTDSVGDPKEETIIKIDKTEERSRDEDATEETPIQLDKTNVQSKEEKKTGTRLLKDAIPIMTTGTTHTESQEFLIRLHTLIIDCGTDILREIFDLKLQNVPLNAVLAKENSTIKDLRRRKLITEKQYGQLYPKHGQVQNSAEFEISLIVCLLGNLPSLGLKMNYAWHEPPYTADISVEADIHRLKMSRNEVENITLREKISPALFQTKWADIEQVLVRLNSAVGSPVTDLKQKINHIKNDPIDSLWEKRRHIINEQWMKMDDIEKEMLHIKTGVKRVREVGQETNTNVKSLRKGVDKKMKEDIKEVKQTLNVRKITAKEVVSLQAEEAYSQLKTNLMKQLVVYYRSEYSTSHLSPLPIEDTPLLEFYPMPEINAVNLERAFGGQSEKKTYISKFRDVFFKGGRRCGEICLTGDAGSAKSSFCKRLALTWCHAKDPNKEDTKYLKDEEIKTMDEFRFVFVVLLRQSFDDCHIIDMVWNQIITKLKQKTISREDLERILYTERCLVILDGLDEWSHPENYCRRAYKAIPHRKAKQCTVLKTTRPWKLRDVKASQIDQKLEITGLSQTYKENSSQDLDSKTKTRKLDEDVMMQSTFTPDVYGHVDASLMNMAELKKLMFKEGKASPIVIKECCKVCKFIKQQKSSDIVNVWPGYTLNDPNDLVFVVLTTTKINIELSWKVHIKVIGQVCEESKTIMYDKENCSLTKETAKNISCVIDKYSGELIKNRTFLSAISASSVMYQKQETGKQEILQIPCIVFYVLVKSVVFLTEETFPEELDGFPVDVREGVFRFCASSAGDFHEKVRMGCKITSGLHPDKHGTLGGFIEHPEYGLCGFTCAHVFRNQAEMFTLKCKEVLKEDDLLRECDVFQPEMGYNNKIGRVVKFIYKEGSSDNDNTGVDAAMIKIEKRAPEAGNFPDEEGIATAPALRYESGKVLGKVGIPTGNPKVQKFGFVTGRTYGEIQFTNAAVKEISFSHDMVKMNIFESSVQIQSTLYKQYHIRSCSEDITFSQLGDSGSLVFIEDEKHDIRCIGMVVGVIEGDNSVVVTPITDILRELGVGSLLSFEHSVAMVNIDHRLAESEERMRNQLDRMQQGMQDRLNGFENRMQAQLNGLESRMQGMLQQVVRERPSNENNNNI